MSGDKQLSMNEIRPKSIVATLDQIAEPMTSSPRGREPYAEYDEEWQRVLNDPERTRIGESWLRDDTVDAWRHARMRAPLNPLIAHDDTGTWLTVGDGRFGTDAQYLMRSGVSTVHCSDISDTLLKIANQRGLIGTYSAENAEALSFDDGQFDYVYCKEALHHFEKPYAALYEMHRVARKAVVITEPRDTSIDKEPVALLKEFAKFLLGKEVVHGNAFEEIGNYIYGFSERELEKFQLGLNQQFVAFTGCNDAYIAGVEFVTMSSTQPADVKIRDSVLSQIGSLDRLCKIGLKKSTLLTAILFKETPTQELIGKLERVGWKVRMLPKNPYRSNLGTSDAGYTV